MAPQGVVPNYPPPPPPRDDTWTSSYMPGKRPKEPPETVSSTTTVYDNPSSTMTRYMESSPSAVAISYSTSGPPVPRESWWGNRRPGDEHHSLSSAVMGAAGAIGTLAFLCLMGALLFFVCRKARRRRQRNKNAGSQEMIKTNGIPDTRAYIQPPTTTPPPTITPPSTASVAPTRHEEPPVLLSTTIEQSYYTGIDTSDIVSVTDAQRNSAADGGYASSIAEPPPPYRPASIPPFSRDSSMRIPSGRPPSYGPRLSVRSQREVIRSPFDDPEGESPISETSESPQRGPSGVRDMEEMSEVSELSYQEEPVVPRSSV